MGEDQRNFHIQPVDGKRKTPGSVSPQAIVSVTGALVRGVNHQRVIGDPGLFKRFQDFTNGPIYFFDGIPNQFSGSPLEVLTDSKWQMHHGVWQIQKERLILMFLNELD